ncbi:TetR/AcrR family transcriptional regulator [Rhodococcus sp. NPDC056960]|uniref:TetR/AcrR family transcriptional regulator n=1 Tax=Rhodococcus sp. NPDC056960 TaxID=3345982 RepID=UPI00363739FA
MALSTSSSEPLTAPPQRKRGAALHDAILTGAFAELSQVGYRAFSIESVAARAGTGKASIYRRWRTKQELVLDAMSALLPTPAQSGIDPVLDESTTTGDALRQVARAIARTLDSPAGRVMRAVKCEAVTDPELASAIDERFQAPGRAGLLALLRRGVDRGEVRPEAVTPLVAGVLPALLAHRILLQREPVSERDLVDIIDTVIIPLVAAPPAAPR